MLAIVNLASAVENHAIFVEEGMLSRLIRLSSANAVVKIVQNACDVRKVMTEGGLEPVLYLAQIEEPEIHREVLLYLYYGVYLLQMLTRLTFVEMEDLKLLLEPFVMALLVWPNWRVAQWIILPR